MEVSYLMDRMDELETRIQSLGAELAQSKKTNAHLTEYVKRFLPGRRGWNECTVCRDEGRPLAHMFRVEGRNDGLRKCEACDNAGYIYASKALLED